MPTDLRVLFLEDDPIDAELEIAMLAEAGYSVVWERADSRQSFLSLLARGTFDVVLADYSLPTIDGTSALRLMRGQGYDLPYILVSGTLGEEVAIESLKAGATDYVLKSHLARLPAVVERALRERDDQRQRRKAIDALRQAEARYRELFENANDMIYTHDLHGMMTSINRVGEQLTGYTRDEAIGERFANLVAPEWREKVRVETAFDLARRREQAIYEVEILRKDGTRVPVEISTRLMLADGEPVGVQGIARDISERRRADAERRRLEAQLLQAQKMETIGTLVGGIAHDFNNVLTAIVGNAQLALDGSSQDDAHLVLLKEIEKAALRAATLTRQLLTFSRRQPMERKPFDVNGAIADLSKMLRRIIGEDIELETHFADGMPPIYADAGQIQQVLMNLVVNARDAMPNGGRLLIETGQQSFGPGEQRAEPGFTPGRFVSICVRDTGVGMDLDIQQRIFEPFFTTKPLGRGTGLGLSVVYGIVQQHGGFIAITSQPGAGSTFAVYLPASVQIVPEPANQPPVPVRGGGETILVAEDEVSLRNLTRAILERLGYTVILAQDGRVALDLFRTHEQRVDLVILDLVMPHYNGREVLAQMRARRPDLRALFVTGYDRHANDQRLANGAESHVALIQKPYSVDTLGQKVRELLDA